MRASASAAERARLGTGALSRAVGIPAETLRTWERRYSFPVPERTPSGHRRYRATDAEAFAVGISCSFSSTGAAASRRLGRLRKRLPRRVKLIVGGAGAPRPCAGIEVIAELRDLAAWARRLAGRAA